MFGFCTQKYKQDKTKQVTGHEEQKQIKLTVHQISRQ